MHATLHAIWTNHVQIHYAVNRSKYHVNVVYVNKVEHVMNFHRTIVKLQLHNWHQVWIKCKMVAPLN